MKYLLLRWLFLAIAIAITAWLMPGMTIYGEGSQYVVNLLIVSVVFGLINAIIRPIVMFFTCPLIILTLGLFALMLSLTDWLLPNIMTVDGFWTTFFAALIISIISGLLGLFLHGEGNW
jgi:putative membrane protein